MENLASVHPPDLGMNPAQISGTTPAEQRRFLKRLAAASTLALLHAPFLFWLRRLWYESPIDEIVLSIFTPIAVAGLLYLRRDAVLALIPNQPTSSRVGKWLLFASMVIAFMSVITGSVLPLGLSAPMSLHGYLAWTRGPERVQPLLIPIYLLLFLVPGTYGELANLSVFLQMASAELATVSLQVMGFPSFRDGITIVTDGTFNHVTEACSGMTTLTTLIVYGLVFSYILKIKPRHIVFSLIAIVVLALVANASRIATISYMLYAYGEEVANGPLHNGCGYVAFGCAYLILFVLMRKFAYKAKIERDQLANSQNLDADTP